MLLSSLPYGAAPRDTGEFMLGDVVATVVFFESNGSDDENQEDWNELQRDQHGEAILDSEGRTINASDGPNLIEETKQRIVTGLEWWEDTLANFYELNYDNQDPVHSLNFVYDFDYAHNPIDTKYEPINRTSDDYRLWASDFLRQTGHLETGFVWRDIRSFNQAQRLKHDADWAYTIFVANDYNEPSGQFAPGGTFAQGFAFSGGRHVVAPANRPPSTFAHETGHIFYARDEYSGSGASYTDCRGYYDSQNWNAYDNPTPGFEQQDSIMDTDEELQGAWATHTSSDSSLEMIGWRDSDSDGVFDVLDVPLTLSGTGYYHPHQQEYHFQGHSEVQTLVNVNSGNSSRGNDITINEVDRLTYSLDEGATWHVAADFDAPEVDIDVALPIQPGQGIWIRSEAIDSGTGEIVATSSEVFRGDMTVPTAVSESGIHGFVWDDRDGDGNWDQGERGVSDWSMQLVDDQGNPVRTAQYVDPDEHDHESLLNEAASGVSLSAMGASTEDARVAAVDVSGGPGGHVFGFVPRGFNDRWATQWTSHSQVLRIDLETPTTFVEIDAIAPDDGARGRLEIYDAEGNMLGRTTTDALAEHDVATLSIGMSSPKIAYALVRSASENFIVLDNLQIGPDSTAVSGDFGAYALPYLPPGNYRVMAEPSEKWTVSDPVDRIVEVSVDANGRMVWLDGAERPSDFAGAPGAGTSRWNNLNLAADVNNDWTVSPIDALTVINELNIKGSRELSPETDSGLNSFVDVSGDFVVSPIDALIVISALNASGHEEVEDGVTGGIRGWTPAVVCDGVSEGQEVGLAAAASTAVDGDPEAETSVREASLLSGWKTGDQARPSPTGTLFPSPWDGAPMILESNASTASVDASSLAFGAVGGNSPEILDLDCWWRCGEQSKSRAAGKFNATFPWGRRGITRSNLKFPDGDVDSELLTSSNSDFEQLLTLIAADASAVEPQQAELPRPRPLG